MSEPTVEQRAHWWALVAAATQGPWTTAPCSNGGLILLRRDERLQTHLQVVPEADAHFIAAAREAVPALLAALERAEARIKELERDWSERIDD